MPKGDKFKLKADPEDGTTPIAHLLLTAIAISSLSGSEKGIVLYLCRITYGWLVGDTRPKEAPLPQQDLADSLHITRKAVFSALKALSENKVLIRRDIGQGKGYIYHINTNIAQWNGKIIDKKTLKLLEHTETTGVEVKNEGSSKLHTPKLLPVTKTTTPDVTKTTHEYNIIKKTIKEIYKEISPEKLNKCATFIDILWGLVNWKEDNSDINWAYEYLAEYPFVDILVLKKCSDYYAEKPAKNKGLWKNRFRNWAENEKKFPKKKSVQKALPLDEGTFVKKWNKGKGDEENGNASDPGEPGNNTKQDQPASGS